MKTAKKSLALLLSAIMLLSSFALISSAAEENRKTVNVQVTAPVVGEKAEFTIKVDDEDFLPGMKEMFSTLGLTSDLYEKLGRMPTSDECVDADIADRLSDASDNNDMQLLYKAYYTAISQLIKNGITWIEYDKNDINRLIEINPEYKSIPVAGLIMSLLSVSEEYGLSTTSGNITYSSSARFLMPEDVFNEGKSYICWTQAEPKIEKELAEYKDAKIALFPYFKEKLELENKYNTVSDSEERELIENELTELRTEYQTQIEMYEAKQKAYGEAIAEKVGEGSGDFPAITVNGNETEIIKQEFEFNSYDFGEAAEKPEEKQSFFDIIKAFFSNIIDFFKNLFSKIIGR